VEESDKSESEVLLPQGPKEDTSPVMEADQETLLVEVLHYLCFPFVTLTRLRS